MAPLQIHNADKIHFRPILTETDLHKIPSFFCICMLNSLFQTYTKQQN